MALQIVLFAIFSLVIAVSAFPQFENRAGVLTVPSLPSTLFTWSPSQLVDVTGEHEYRDPLPGQARGPCPAQNALANHGYLDRSGYTSFAQCVDANKEVFNMEVDFATYLCFNGQLTGGDLVGLTWSIGNSTEFDVTIQDSCSSGGLLGSILNLGCAISKVLSRAFGTPGFGMAQTHNSFEGDSSFFHPDWNTVNGLDASSMDMAAARDFFSRKLPDGTFDDLNIFIDWASHRKEYGIRTNPCYFRAPGATLFAALGAYSLAARLFSNHTVEKPAGTLNGKVLTSFQGISIKSDGSLRSKGLGKERIPNNWYKRPVPYTIAEWLTLDYSRFHARDPSLGSIGGNTDGVNTFTGIDMGNLTGGVINGQNLFEGDNFACFYYRLLQIYLENKLPSKVGAGLLQLGTTLGQVIDKVFGNMVHSPNGVAGCPKFKYSDLSNQGNWCAVRQQPGGIY